MLISVALSLSTVVFSTGFEHHPLLKVSITHNFGLVYMVLSAVKTLLSLTVTYL